MSGISYSCLSFTEAPPNYEEIKDLGRGKFVYFNKT